MENLNTTLSQLEASNKQKLESLMLKIDQLKAQLLAAEQEAADIQAAKRLFSKSSSVAPTFVGGSTLIRNAAISTLPKTLSKREAILGAAHQIITDFQPVLTDVLLEKIIASGVQISGEGTKGQLANLAAYLSRAKTQLNIKPSRRGWQFVPTDETITQFKLQDL